MNIATILIKMVEGGCKLQINGRIKNCSRPIGKNILKYGRDGANVSPKDDLQAARNAAARQLGLHFLDADFLEVDKLGVVQIEREFLPIGTLRVLAASWLVVSTELITIGQQMVNGQWSGRPLTWVYLNCCWTFLMTVWQSKQVNVPATNSGWTGWVRVT